MIAGEQNSNPQVPNGVFKYCDSRKSLGQRKQTYLWCRKSNYRRKLHAMEGYEMIIKHIKSDRGRGLCTRNKLRWMHRSWNIGEIRLMIYTLPAKNMEYFSFQRFFFNFVGCVGYFFIWFTFLQADITFGELIHTQWQTNRKGSKTIILVLFLY